MSNDSTDRIVVVTPAELRQLIGDAVREALADRAAPDEWLDTAGAAALMQLHPRTVAKLAKKRGAPGDAGRPALAVSKV